MFINLQNEEEKLIESIHEFIDRRIEQDENGEPPDEDTVIEGMGLSDEHWDLVGKAYEIYWRK